MTAAEVLLQAEHRTLIPILRDLSPEKLTIQTVCTEWSIIDVVAHVGAALSFIARGESYDNSPAGNAAQVEQRRSWPSDRVIDEYEQALVEAAPMLAAGGWDSAALGTWIHGGDVRGALDHHDAYASPGFDEAITLLQASERVVCTPLVRVTLPHRTLSLGQPKPGRHTATLSCDVASLFCLYTGRPAHQDRFRLVGAQPGDLVSHQW